MLTLVLLSFLSSFNIVKETEAPENPEAVVPFVRVLGANKNKELSALNNCRNSECIPKRLV